MRKLKYITLFLIMATLLSCQKDPMSEITDGKWNKERNIINLSFEGQVGTTTISRAGDVATINFTYNTSNSANFSAIKINALELSYQATASVKVGETLNFENATKTATISVTPANGEPLTWVIKLFPFTETLLGVWDITSLYVYGGTGPEYGGAGIIKMSDKPWCWPATEGSSAEQDNFLTFTLTGISADGNTNGKVVNNAGADGKYANFIYIAKTPNVDVNNFYRAIPKGEGTWSRNYATGMVTFTFPDGTTRQGLFASPGKVDLGNGKSRTLTNNAFTFTLNGTDDWGNIYNDFDKFVKRPRVYWVDIKKR